MIILVLWIANACEVITDNLQIYPTENQTYILPLQSLFTGQNLSYVCKDCPDSVSIYNPMNMLHEQDIQSNYVKYKDQITRNLNSNRTHFVILTKEQQFNLYKYTDYTMIRLYSIQISDKLYCFNAFFNQLGQIFLDCYDSDNNLIFQMFNGTTLINYQTFNNSLLPTRTKPLSFFTQTKIYFIYGQFFQNYEILTILTQDKKELINQTTWKGRFVDFTTSTRGFIYILSSEDGIFQTRINISNQLNITYSYAQKETYLKIAVGVNYNQNSQCDNIVVATSNPKSYLLSYMAWDWMIVYLGIYVFDDLNFSQYTVIQILLSEFYLVVQQNNSFTISSAVSLIYESDNNDRHLIVFHHQKDPNQIYSHLDISNNYLFEFSEKIKIYSLKNPQLIGKFTKSQTNKFTIAATDRYFPFLNKFCEISVRYYLLTQDDKNIYLLYNKTKQPAIIMEGSVFNYALTTFSGPLLNFSGILQNPSLGSFQDKTFQKISVTFNQRFTITKLFYIKNLGQLKLFFVGGSEDSVFFYFCKLNYECVQIYQDLSIYHINQIEITYCYQYKLIVAINQGLGEIQVYFVDFANYESQGEVSVNQHILYCQEYIQFLLNYDNILVLQKNNEILIRSFNLIDYFILDGKKAKELLSEDFDFTPKEIQLNEQNQASSLFINLGENILIMVIQSTNEIVPLDLLRFDFNIEKLNIVNNQLIVSYQCSDLICLQVWKIYETAGPYFMQELPSLKMKDTWKIQSDNFFLYILSEQDIMYVISSTLTYHSALYYQFPFKGNYISSAYLGKHSLISYCNQLFSLSAQIIQQFTANPTETTSNYISQTFYHFSVTNPYSTKPRQTQNDILNIFNPLTQINFNNDTYTINYTQKGNFIVNISEQIVSSGQILQYQINDSQKTRCNITNYINYTSYSPTQYNILSILNGQLIQQNNISLSIGNSGGQNYSYKTPFENCSISYIYNQNLYSICRNLTQNYLTIFQLQNMFNLSSTIQTTYQLSVLFENTKKLFVVNNFISILLANEPFNDFQIYIFNIINGTNTTQITCDYGIQDFTIISEPNSSLYIIFYICQNSLFYKTGQLVNNSLTFEKLKHEVLSIEKSYLLRSTQLIQIEVLFVKFHEILMLLTTSNMTSLLLTTSYTKFNETYFDLDLQEIIQTIPPYGNYNMTYNTMVSNGLIFCVYYSGSERVFAIYNYKTISKSFQDPLIMQGGINQNLPLPQSIVWNITSIYEGGTLYEITNGQLNQYLISNSTFITCYLEQKKKIEDCTLIASNSFSNSSGLLQFQFISYETYWFIGLIIFVLIVFGIQIIVYWYNAQDSEDQNDEDYEELQLDL